MYSNIYALIKDNKIDKVEARPRWIDSNGNPVSDELLRAHNYLPVEFKKPTYDAFYKYAVRKDQSEWTINSDKVSATYDVLDYSTEEIKDRSLQEINDRAQEAVSKYIESYPQFEIQSWYVQEKEARAYLEDRDAPTPFCDIASATRGVPKDIFIYKIINKADDFAQISAYIAGYRQRLEDQISEASREELKSIVWNLDTEQ